MWFTNANMNNFSPLFNTENHIHCLANNTENSRVWKMQTVDSYTLLIKSKPHIIKQWMRNLLASLFLKSSSVSSNSDMSSACGPVSLTLTALCAGKVVSWDKHGVQCDSLIYFYEVKDYKSYKNKTTLSVKWYRVSDWVENHLTLCYSANQNLPKILQKRLFSS